MSPRDRLALFSVSRGLARSSVRQAVASFGRRLPPAIGPEDLESHALLALWDACEAYEPSRGSFPPYARKAIDRRVRRAMYSFHRDRDVESLSEAADRHCEALVSKEVDPWLQAAHNIERDRLYSELSRLPERIQFATLLSMRGFGPTEIGRELGISRQRANQLPREAVVMIRKQIAAANLE